MVDNTWGKGNTPGGQWKVKHTGKNWNVKINVSDEGTFEFDGHDVEFASHPLRSRLGGLRGQGSSYCKDNKMVIRVEKTIKGLIPRKPSIYKTVERELAHEVGHALGLPEDYFDGT